MCIFCFGIMGSSRKYLRNGNRAIFHGRKLKIMYLSPLIFEALWVKWGYMRKLKFITKTINLFRQTRG